METVQDIFASIWSTVLSGFAAMGLVTAPAPSSYQGYVEGEFVMVAPVIGGTLQTLSVQRGMHVQKGDSLFALDQTDEKAALDQATAMLQQARDRLANITKSRRSLEIEMIAAQKSQAEAQMRLAEVELDRQERLRGSPAFNKEVFDQTKATYDQQRARVEELTKSLDFAQSPMGREDELHAAEGDIKANEAALAQAQWRLDQKTLTAPTSALVADTYFNPGESIAANQAVVSLLPPENIKVRFFVAQEDLARLPIGARILVHCDGCPATIPAVVRFVSPQAEDTPPVLYNRENRNKLVFMLEARPTERAEALRPGQPVDVTIAPP